MLHRDHLQLAFEAGAAAFDDFEAQRTGYLEALSLALDALDAGGYLDLVASLEGHRAPGALPGPEWRCGTRVPFPRRFKDHPEARAWACEILEGSSSFAADGSQIEPDRRFSVPVALLQVATFENLHGSGEGSYRKLAELKIMGPAELREDEVGPPKRKVDLARFELEVAAMRRYLQAPGQPGQKRLAFFDGSLIVSFAEKRKQDAFSQRYVELVLGLVADSERFRVPLIAYVDTSYARDLATMLGAWRGLEGAGPVSDAALWLGRLGWGDRTPVAICAREGILDAYGDEARRIGFVYLQTSQDAPPARLEFPMWLVDDQILEPVLDHLRAEVIAGAGYPYALAAADAAAVLTQGDRESFYRHFQEFLARRGTPLRFSIKALSKLRRR